MHSAEVGSAIYLGGAFSLECYLFFLRPLVLDRNDFKFASALSAIPLQRKLPLGAIPPLTPQIIERSIKDIGIRSIGSGMILLFLTLAANTLCLRGKGLEKEKKQMFLFVGNFCIFLSVA